MVTCAHFANGPRIKNRLPCHGNFKEVGPYGERRSGIKNRLPSLGWGHVGWEFDAGPSAGSAEPRHLFKIEHAKLKVGLSAGRTGPRIQETFFWDQVRI